MCREVDEDPAEERRHISNAGGSETVIKQAVMSPDQLVPPGSTPNEKPQISRQNSVLSIKTDSRIENNSPPDIADIQESDDSYFSIEALPTDDSSTETSSCTSEDISSMSN